MASNSAVVTESGDDQAKAMGALAGMAGCGASTIGAAAGAGATSAGAGTGSGVTAAGAITTSGVVTLADSSHICFILQAYHQRLSSPHNSARRNTHKRFPEKPPMSFRCRQKMQRRMYPSRNAMKSAVPNSKRFAIIHLPDVMPEVT
ncbi:MAG: hypothetical protein DSZ33_03190 [Gammaproteobacteria bacterium]|nr:MAG: hypothetical protein DSZ33_03190 [Gammaproteobacteria bacterium]